MPVPAEFEPGELDTEVQATVSRPVARALDPARWLAGGRRAGLERQRLGEVPELHLVHQPHGACGP